MPRIDLIKLRRGTAAQWTSANPVLAEGEYGFETDTLQSKIGNGTDNWNDLSYLSASSGATPNLQQVTDEGTTTTNDVTMQDGAKLLLNRVGGFQNWSVLNSFGSLRFLNEDTLEYVHFLSSRITYFNTVSTGSFNFGNITSDRVFLLPDKDITVAGLEDLIEENIFSDLTENTTVSGTYTFDFDNSRRKVLEMTADTDFSVESLTIGKAAAFNVTLTGDFAPTWLSTTVTPTSDTYDGTIDNRLTFDCYRKADGTQVNILTIENLS